MRLSIQISLLAALLLLPRARADDIDFSTYMAKSRTAEELIKAAEDLNTGARLTLVNTKIVIAGTKRQRQAVLELFGNLDQKLRSYLVQVRAANKKSGTRDSYALEGSAGGRGVGIGKKSTVLKRSGGGTVSMGGVAVSGESSEESGSDQDVQTVQVQEGSSSRLWSGGAIPETLIVKVRAIGQAAAHVEFWRQNPKSGPGLSSEIDLRLGEWRTVGGITQSGEAGSGEILGRERSKNSGRGDVQIRVDLAN